MTEDTDHELLPYRKTVFRDLNDKFITHCAHGIFKS